MAQGPDMMDHRGTSQQKWPTGPEGKQNMFRMIIARLKTEAIARLASGEDITSERVNELAEEIERLESMLSDVKDSAEEALSQANDAKDTAEGVEYKLEYEVDLDEVQSVAQNAADEVEEFESRISELESQVATVESAINNFEV